MKAPFIDIHTHVNRTNKDTITVNNILPGEGFAAFSGRNFYSVGLHPWHIGEPEENNQLLKMVEEALEFDHVIMVGECGLDKVINTDYKEQLRVFEAQALLAEEFEYPLIIHCVKSFNEILEIHKKNKPLMPWIIHGFKGSTELGRQLCDKGIMLSFGKSLVVSNSKSRNSFKHIPLEKVFLETDEMEIPVEQIYKEAARLKEISVGELKEKIFQNFAEIEKTITNKS